MTLQLRIPKTPSAQEVVNFAKNDPHQSAGILSVSRFKALYGTELCIGIGLWKGMIGESMKTCLQVLVKTGEREIHAKMLYATTAITTSFDTLPDDALKLPAYCVFNEVKLKGKDGDKEKNASYFWELSSKPIMRKDALAWKKHWDEHHIDFGGVARSSLEVLLLLLVLPVIAFLLSCTTKLTKIFYYSPMNCVCLQNCSSQASLPMKKRHLAVSAPDPWAESKKQKLDPAEDSQVLVTDDEDDEDADEDEDDGNTYIGTQNPPICS